MMPRLVTSKQIGDYRYEKYNLSGGSKPKKKSNSQPIYFPAAHSDDDANTDDSDVYEVQKRTIMRQRKPVAATRDKVSLCPIHGGTSDRSTKDPTYFDRVLECPDTETETESTDGPSRNQASRRRPEIASDDEISSGKYSRNSDWQSEQETRPRCNDRRPAKQEMDKGRRKPRRYNHSPEPEKSQVKSHRYRDESEDSEEERPPRQVQRQRKPVRKEKRDNEEESDDNRPPKMPIKQRKPVHKERRDNEDDSDIESPRRPAQRRNRPALKPRSDYNEVYEEEAYRPSQAPTKTKKTAKAECRGDVKYQKKPVRSSSRAYTEDNDFEEHQYLPKTKDHKTRKQAEQRREGSKHDQGYDRTPPRPSVKSADRPRKPKRDYVEERTTTRSEYQYSDTSNDEDSTSETTDSSNDSLPTRWAKPPQHPEKRFVENNSQRRRPRDRTEEKDYPQRRCRPPRNSSYRI
uniref:Uncharacterized protein n=1 Tax=Schistocephalus solidus TaxID=70667 RepID=A0A0X3PIX6_SCHSO